MREVPLTRGKVAFVDDEDYEAVVNLSWHAQLSNNTWYAAHAFKTGRKGHSVLMHVFLLGKQPNRLIDHRNGNGLDNRRYNLRRCSRSQNIANSRRRSDCSVFKGVTFLASRQRFSARIAVNGRRHHLGYFRTAEEASHAYDLAAVRYFGEFAHPNHNFDLDDAVLPKLDQKEAIGA